MNIALSALVLISALAATETPQAPDGWIIIQNIPARLEMQGPAVTNLPFEATFRVRMPEANANARLAVVAEGIKDPLVVASLFRRAGNNLQVTAQADGLGMPAMVVSSRGWNERAQDNGVVQYEWRFDTVKNLWDDRDRNEIGASYSPLTPFDNKTFVVKFVVTPSRRQVWIDSRLVAEKSVETAGPVNLNVTTGRGAEVVAANTAIPADQGRFLPLQLDDYQSDGSPRAAGELLTATTRKTPNIPVQLPGSGNEGFDLGNSLYRYRLTVGTGPEAPYVNGRRAWPSPMSIDPAEFNLRVPYRDYRNVYLTAWVDDDKDSVPAGTVRFYRDMAGRCAQSDFEISDAAIARGDVTPLDRKAPNGKPLFLVKVPVNTDGLYDFKDSQGELLDLQISKPVRLGRSYPDPIYYGRHPVGLPSSVHVLAVTLEEGSFAYSVVPSRTEHVFEAVETPAYTIPVTNHTDTPLPVTVTLETSSYDESEQTSTTSKATIPSNAVGNVEVTLDRLSRFGWHKLYVRVAAGDEVRECRLSLLKLPRDRRTWGFSANETRFGMWLLLGHYTPFGLDKTYNEKVMVMLRKLGLRKISAHSSFFDVDMLKRHDFLPKGAHTIVGFYHRLDVEDPEQVAKWIEDEKKLTAEQRDNWSDGLTYYYGGEWNYDHIYSYAMLPQYSGGEIYKFSEASLKNLHRQMKMFTTVGKTMRELSPSMKLVLQWGSPLNAIGFLQEGFDDKLIDLYGMDAPQFELTPEVPSLVGTINQLWQFRKEVDRLGRRQLPISWCEGPFFPTNEGAMSFQEQEQNQIRYWLLGLAYGVEDFEAGVVPHDAGNYYGAEHYGAGVFEPLPRECPKPAAAAIATATNMLCGANVVGPVNTGVLTTYCMSFKRNDGPLFALWRVIGSVSTTISVTGKGPAILTDSMGNATSLPVNNGKITLAITPSPQWLTGVETINGFSFDSPKYDEKPAAITHALPAFTKDAWTYDGSEVESYAKNHFGQTRLTDPDLIATVGNGAGSHGPAANISLPEQPVDDRPLPQRYGALVLNKPAPIPGKASHLGVWINGNSSWGRIAWQLRDARGETWTSIGTKDDWNCDDTHTWSFIKFEGWRYVRFPLPGNHPWDAARELETTWWKSEGGDGIVDLPLSVEKVFIEARNAVHYLGEMKPVSIRTWQITDPVAEYESQWHTGKEVIALHALRKTTAQWSGPESNLIAQLKADNEGDAPVIQAFEEPLHFNDGRRMVLLVKDGDAVPDQEYKLYLSRFADGRGAEIFGRPVKNHAEVRGFRPGIEMYLFMTKIEGKTESKPSAAYKLVTEDKFREK